MRANLLYVSFFAGVTGNCPAEWADDKLSIFKGQFDVTLLTCIYSSHVSSEALKIYRIPSLSFIDLVTEVKEAQKRNVKLPILAIMTFLPLILTLGPLIDAVSLLITRKVSGAKLSWFIPALCVMLFVTCTRQVSKVFATGGAMSAQIASSIFCHITSIPTISEFQDPLVGATMTTVSLSARVERFIVSHTNKIVFVTEAAANKARLRHPQYAEKIHCIYPGSAAVDLALDDFNPKNIIKLVHCGTLYGTRNLNLLLKAITILRDTGRLGCQIEIVNVGEIYCDEREQYIKSGLVKIVPEQPRQKAISFLDGAIPLLIQHDDIRSEETIPYKTYDYLNSGRIIFGILYSSELFDLLHERGHLVANASLDATIENILSLQNLKTYQIGDFNCWTTRDCGEQLLNHV